MKLNDTKRRPLTSNQRYAALILDQKKSDGTPYITRDDALYMTALEVIEMFESMTDDDHYIMRSLGMENADHFARYQIIDKAAHKKKTPADIKAIAKTKRVIKKRAVHEAKLAAKVEPEPVPAPMPKPKAKIRSRPMMGTKASGIKKRMNGEVTRREIRR